MIIRSLIVRGLFVRGYRAAVLKQPKQSLVIEEKQPRKLSKGQVRINVYNCAVNSYDVVMSDEGFHKLPVVPGFELSGEVTEVDKTVTSIKPGDRVIGINDKDFGGFAEEAVLHEQHVWRLQQGMGFDTAASLLDCYGTAMLGLQRRANIQPDNTVLITAAAGGLGLAAVDVAANVFKAKVIGICGTADKAQLVRDKGAWSALKYKDSNVVATVNDVTKGEGVDVCFDAVGGDAFENIIKSVRFEGKVIVAGFASHQVPQIRTSLLLPKALSLIGISLSDYALQNTKLYRRICEEVIALYNNGLISPHISMRFSLDQVNDALDFMRERKSTGKVILDIK